MPTLFDVIMAQRDRHTNESWRLSKSDDQRITRLVRYHETRIAAIDQLLTMHRKGNSK